MGVAPWGWQGARLLERVQGLRPVPTLPSSLELVNPLVARAWPSVLGAFQDVQSVCSLHQGAPEDQVPLALGSSEPWLPTGVGALASHCLPPFTMNAGFLHHKPIPLPPQPLISPSPSTP